MGGESSCMKERVLVRGFEVDLEEGLAFDRFYFVEREHVGIGVNCLIL